jgi:hypothetical protein
MAGLAYLDAIAAVVVAIMIAKIGWELGWEAINELVDTGLESERLSAVKETIRSVGGVRDIHMLRTRRYAGQVSADVHVLVDPLVSVSEGHMISLLVEHRLKREIDEITDVTVHIDPEDDDRFPPPVGLPLRAEAMARLASLWSAIPEANERQRMVFHYLRGGIDIEVHFPLWPRADERARTRPIYKRGSPQRSRTSLSFAMCESSSDSVCTIMVLFFVGECH